MKILSIVVLVFLAIVFFIVLLTYWVTKVNEEAEDLYEGYESLEVPSDKD